MTMTDFHIPPTGPRYDLQPPVESRGELKDSVDPTQVRTLFQSKLERLSQEAIDIALPGRHITEPQPLAIVPEVLPEPESPLITIQKAGESILGMRRAKVSEEARKFSFIRALGLANNGPILSTARFQKAEDLIMKDEAIVGGAALGKPPKGTEGRFWFVGDVRRGEHTYPTWAFVHQTEVQQQVLTAKHYYLSSAGVTVVEQGKQPHWLNETELTHFTRSVQAVQAAVTEKIYKREKLPRHLKIGTLLGIIK